MSIRPVRFKQNLLVQATLVETALWRLWRATHLLLWLNTTTKKNYLHKTTMKLLLWVVNIKGCRVGENWCNQAQIYPYPLTRSQTKFGFRILSTKYLRIMYILAHFFYLFFKINHINSCMWPKSAEAISISST